MTAQISSKNLCLLLLIATLPAVLMVCPRKTLAAPVMSLTVATNKGSYYIREPVALNGTMLEDSQPATNTLASVEVDNQRGFPLLFRTVPIGNPAPAPPQVWWLNITAVGVTDSSFNMTNSIRINSVMYLYATLHNNLATQYSVIVTGTVFDGNLIPVIAVSSGITMGPNQNQSVSWSVSVPEWAYSGKALAVVNVYNDFPRNGGTPITPETPYVFYLTRNSAVATPYSVLPAANTSAPGQYGIAFRMPPDIYTVPGTYSVYATALSPSNHLSSTASASFNLVQAPSPPQAAFTYTPLQVYRGMDVTFDASSSSAEGTGVTITQYAWIINDPYNYVQTAGTSPYLSHVFSASGTFVVQLNVTNSVGLWSTTAKPVVVNPDFGPTANFTWTPPMPVANLTVYFNASSSQLGWSSQIPGYANITSYKWIFGDGTTNTTSTSTIQHAFKQPGNYTVTLNVTDSVSRTNQISQTIQVSNHPAWDVNGDGTVNMKDIALVARAFGSKPGDSNWNPACDINADSVVNMKDIAIVARHFGQND